MLAVLLLYVIMRLGRLLVVAETEFSSPTPEALEVFLAVLGLRPLSLDFKHQVQVLLLLRRGIQRHLAQVLLLGRFDQLINVLVVRDEGGFVLQGVPGAFKPALFVASQAPLGARPKRLLAKAHLSRHEVLRIHFLLAQMPLTACVLLESEVAFLGLDSVQRGLGLLGVVVLGFICEELFALVEVTDLAGDLLSLLDLVHLFPELGALVLD